MSSTNQGPEYFEAEKKYLSAQTPEQKIVWLEEMIRNFKKHKGSEGMLSNIKQRLTKLKEKQEKSKKTGKTSKKGIKKEGHQIALLGLTNSGKSSIIAKLTNAKPKANPFPFTTKTAEVGTFYYEGVKAQIIDLPSIGSENFDSGIVNTADTLIIVVVSFEEIDKVLSFAHKSSAKKIIVFNKADLLSDQELRKLQERIKSKKIKAVIISCSTGFGINELKEKIIHEMDIVRVYTKEPGKSPSPIPVVLSKGSTVKAVAENIRKGFYLTIRETRLTGPSSKFSNQKVGLSHVLADRDIVEFHT